MPTYMGIPQKYNQTPDRGRYVGLLIWGFAGRCTPTYASSKFGQDRTKE